MFFMSVFGLIWTDPLLLHGCHVPCMTNKTGFLQLPLNNQFHLCTFPLWPDFWTDDCTSAVDLCNSSRVTSVILIASGLTDRQCSFIFINLRHLQNNWIYSGTKLHTCVCLDSWLLKAVVFRDRRIKAGAYTDACHTFQILKPQGAA